MMSEPEWEEFINSLRADEIIEDKGNAKELLEEAIVNAAKQGLPAKGEVGVLFSGGVDSCTIALILKKLGADFTCCSVGLEGAEDIEWAQKAAKELNFKLKTRILSESDVEEVIEKLAGFLEDFDILKAGVGCVTYAAAELAKKHGCKVIFTGLGSEEIFAGYQRHLEASMKSKDINKECWEGLLSMHKRDFMRDLPIAEKLKIKIKTPFLDKQVISIAMKIPGKYKLSNEQNKIILREVAENIGLPKEFCQRKKRAAQYGSRFDKAIKRIAKQKGFIKKSDYIRSLADKGKKGGKK